MLAELFDKVFNRLDTRHKPELVTFAKPNGALNGGFFTGDGRWSSLYEGLADPKFPAVKVFSAQSLIAYASTHASTEIAEKATILSVSRAGLRLVVDYVQHGDPQRREHVVEFPAVYDQECEAAAAAITGALGKWIVLDAFDALLDKCAPFIANFTALEDAASNMEGHETAKIAKTKTSYQVAVSGDVTCTVDIPKAVEVRLMFMGNPVAADIPIRLTVENKQVKFHLVDNGALAKAQMQVLRAIKAEVVAALPDLLVIDGSIG